MIPRFSFLTVALLILSCCFAQSLQAQAATYTSYVEIGSNIGNTSGTVSFEHRIISSPKDRLHLYARAGFGQFHAFHYEPSGPGAKLGLSILTGRKKHHFETELGLMSGRHVRLNDDRPYLLPMFSLGYRYQPPHSGLMIKGFVGFLGVGLGIGYAWSRANK